MKDHKGVWLPDHEKHLVEMMTPGTKRYDEMPDGRPTYQRHKYIRALSLVRDPVVFMDIGAHVGLWSMQAERDFKQIIAFEPHPDHASIYPHNMKTNKYELNKCALGDRVGYVGLTGEKGSSGDTHVCKGDDIPIKLLDEFDYQRVDLMKIDTEGYELPIIVGGMETIMRCKPVIVVEQKGRDVMYHKGTRNAAVDLLKQLGMKELAKPISGDYFMGW